MQPHQTPMPIHIYRNTKRRSSNESTLTKGITTIGDTVIGDILDQVMILLPLTIDPLALDCFGPILQHFLFDIQPASPLTFTQANPNTASVYSKIMHFPSSKELLTLADHIRKTTRIITLILRSFIFCPEPHYPHAPTTWTPLTKAFTLHIHYAA